MFPRLFPFRGLARKNLLTFSGGAALNDTGEEMYAPYLPLFATIFLKVTPEQYGLIEGITDAINRSLRLFTGVIADRWGRKPPVILGYLLISLSRLGLPLVKTWGWLIPFRALRQVGRSFRDPAREASIAESVPENQRGKAFGLLNSVDTVGAVIGPLIGLLVLSIATYGEFGISKNTYTLAAFKWLFILAAIPTLISAMVILFFLKETLQEHHEKTAPSIFQGVKLYAGNRPLVHVTLSNAVLAVGAAPVSMILLYAYKELNATAAEGGMLFVIYSVVHFLTSYPAGFMVDHIGRWKTQVIGDILCILALLSIIIVPASLLMAIPLALYGTFDSIWIASRRAVVSDLAPANARAQALGTFSTIYGLASFLSPILIGTLWHRMSPKAAFITAASLCFVSIILLQLSKPRVSLEKT